MFNIPNKLKGNKRGGSSDGGTQFHRQRVLCWLPLRSGAPSDTLDQPSKAKAIGPAPNRPRTTCNLMFIPVVRDLLAWIEQEPVTSHGRLPVVRHCVRHLRSCRALWHGTGMAPAIGRSFRREACQKRCWPSWHTYPGSTSYFRTFSVILGSNLTSA